MTRFAMAVMCGPAFVLSVFVGLTQGNPLAWGLAIGFAAPVVGTFLLVVPARPAPRKAGPPMIDLRRAYPSDDPTMVATFHGAPTFGHKIAKPSGPPRKPSDASRSARP